ncbi:MAG: hypothetical protein Kow00109_30030 [Acidobacteriota bacterium]
MARRFIPWIVPAALVVWAGAVDLTPEQEKEAKAIENLLIAPCCWRQPVAVHYSQAADDVRAEIRQLLAQGLTRQEILDHFVAEYGPQILAKPKAEGFGATAYYLPVLFLLAGGGVALLVIRRLRPSPAAATAASPLPAKPDKKYSERLERELWG